MWLRVAFARRSLASFFNMSFLQETDWLLSESPSDSPYAFLASFNVIFSPE